MSSASVRRSSSVGVRSSGPAGLVGSRLAVRASSGDGVSGSAEAGSAGAGSSSSEAAAAAPAAAPAARSLTELGAYPAAFLFRRWLAFIGIIFGYACFYLTRNSLTYTAPALVQDASLGIGMAEVGAMTSIFPIAYGTSKFISGVLGSRTSPRALLAGGLAVTAALNVGFGVSSLLPVFCVLWALNGMLQGVGAPCCARILTSWYATAERGTYWGMWNVAHNMGGFAAPVLVGAAAKRWGWRAGMLAPGVVGLAMAALLLLLIRDTPEKAGFLPVEAPKAEAKAPESEAAAAPKQKESLVSLLVSDCLKNPYVVLLALTYFFVYVVRQGVTSWFVFYLMQVKGVPDAGAAGLRVSGLELGGLFGSLLAGRLSDFLIKRAKPGEGTVGKRVQVMIAYIAGVALSLAAFAAAPADASALQWAAVFAIGFFLYGPQMMVGLAGAELVRPESVGASQGFLGWIAYLGAAGAGIPLAHIVKAYGWKAYFTTLTAACAGAAALLAPMINAKNYNQVHAKED